MTTQRADTLGAIDPTLLPQSSDPSPVQAIIDGLEVAREGCDHVQIVSMPRESQAPGAKAISRPRGFRLRASSGHASYLNGIATNVLDAEPMCHALPQARPEEVGRTVKAMRETTTSRRDAQLARTQPAWELT